MVPRLLEVLDFRSNNDAYRPVIRALEVIKQYAGTKLQTFPVEENVPLDFVPALWRDAVVEDGADGRPHVNRITYEIAALNALRDQVRCKEIHVAGANRYRDPDEDVPADFEMQREAYYAALKLPRNPDAFVADLRDEMRIALQELNDGLPRNVAVKISNKAGGWIGLSPLVAQAEPQNVAALKSEVSENWPMTSLLDMLKETDLRLNFTDALRSVTSHENLEREVLRPRLLLYLHGIGTNTGLQRMNPIGHGATYKDLIYTRRRYITVDQLRKAIAIVADGTLHVRNPAIWGDGTTACASDSKHFGAWDQNLTTQWHMRYGGPGIMIYWHVECKSLCIHSQLKSPSSSEVASMIEGVIRHITEMEIDRQYVDSHGQSEVAFAFCRLLGFQLLPRLKAIHSQRLYRPDGTKAGAYVRLNHVLTRPIDWELIRQQYDQMVKYATALRLGTAQTESILRRFTRNNVQHPTYKALAELGKAVKTVFLCRYLNSEALRREIHEGLNVIEQWNGANDFVFFAKRGDLASNRHEDHEVSMLSLHLLQNCLVYINTLMMQQILRRPHWENRLTPVDLRAITPLIWEHVNPYGRFELDMDSRLALG
jgi:TnpA family transposase